MKNTLAALPVLLVALIAGLTGCTNTLIVPPGEAAAHPEARYSRIVRASHVDGVYIKATVPDTADSLVRIAFDKEGGRIDPVHLTVTGTDTLGQARSFDIDKLAYVEFQQTDAGRRFMLGPALIALLHEKNVSMDRLRRGSAAPYYDVVEFRHGAVYDSTGNAIVGTTRRGTVLHTPIDQVFYLRYTWRNWERTFRVALGMATAAAVAGGTAVVLNPK